MILTRKLGDLLPARFGGWRLRAGGRRLRVSRPALPGSAVRAAPGAGGTGSRSCYPAAPGKAALAAGRPPRPAVRSGASPAAGLGSAARPCARVRSAVGAAAAPGETGALPEPSITCVSVERPRRRCSDARKRGRKG